ncbi:hypothetical protein P7H60_13560 [Vagococcus carniphilus]|uniref:hypothetical protein n=1 Tax=Vagococcus carniphilus TaxID=218144 RepID=UPI00288FB360|nr:hypothetical protein [Vagococcus carniphilus]MDT2850176.1 hypothetical protein [Vagococcus carniphilus]
MSITRKELSKLLKETGYPVFRDQSPDEKDYPYIVYSFVGENDKRASGKVLNHMPLYQVSLFTKGIEEDFRPIKNLLSKNTVGFSSMRSIPANENDNLITNFFIYVRCIEDVEE